MSPNHTVSDYQELREEKYTLGPDPSCLVYLREGQAITVRFRGNIGYLDGVEEKTLVFNSNLRDRLAFQVNHGYGDRSNSIALNTMLCLLAAFCFLII